MLKLLALDRFTILLFVMVILASILPVSGHAAEIFSVITTAAIAVLFFLHGAKLSREAVMQGLTHWKLHGLVFCDYVRCVSHTWIISKAYFSTDAGTRIVLGLSVHVFFTLNSTIFNCLYLCGSR